MMSRIVSIVACAAIMTGVPVHAQDLDNAEQACAASKLKATGKKAAAKLKCEAKVIAKEQEPTDPECLAKAEEKFLKAFAKAEGKGGCVSEGDAVAVEANVDQFVGEEVTRQETGASGPPTCPTLSSPCGSCGGGTCAPYSGGGNACINPTGAVLTGCLSDAQCADGLVCVGTPPTTGCAAPCP